MSTPMETNTEELREILQTVYNLPMAGGGSAEPDLVITPDENFQFRSPAQNSTYNIGKVSFDPTAVVSTYEKLMGGKDVRAVLTGIIGLNSYSPKFMTTQPAMRVIAYDHEVFGLTGDFLVVKFEVVPAYFFLSDDAAPVGIEYRFEINPDTKEANLDVAVYWG